MQTGGSVVCRSMWGLWPLEPQPSAGRGRCESVEWRGWWGCRRTVCHWSCRCHWSCLQVPLVLQVRGVRLCCGQAGTLGKGAGDAWCMVHGAWCMAGHGAWLGMVHGCMAAWLHGCMVHGCASLELPGKPWPSRGWERKEKKSYAGIGEHFPHQSRWGSRGPLKASAGLMCRRSSETARKGRLAKGAISVPWLNDFTSKPQVTVGSLMNSYSSNSTGGWRVEELRARTLLCQPQRCLQSRLLQMCRARGANEGTRPRFLPHGFPTRFPWHAHMQCSTCACWH